MFGLHRFNTASNAFRAIEGGYGESYDGYDEMHILTDYEFQRMVFERFCFLALAKKINEPIINYPWRDVEETYEYAMPSEENGNSVNDYFTDFNYFLSSSFNGEFYTCVMTFKDDGVTKFDDEQWDVAFRLIDTYNLCFLWEQAKRIVENNKDIDCFDCLYNYMAENDLCPFTVSNYRDLTIQLNDILEKEINNELKN